ncbi:GGDEF domain-containing protein [Euzebya tangerina]|uniref:GGDEF domain-containing protein n=1 Tax=Euzebya tangerina TaxID=591198 RepID=UPI000E30DE5D|nr:sensor domain-containing diguanylate cyclase [Euzebya tangerina]
MCAPPAAGPRSRGDLGRLVIAISGATTFKEVLAATGAFIADQTGADRVDNMRTINDGDEVRFTRIGGSGAPGLDEIIVLPSANLPMRSLMAHGSLVRSEITPSASGDAYPLLDEAGMRHMMLIPFMIGEELVCAVRLMTGSEVGFSEADEELAQHVTYLVTGWVVRRRLETRLERSQTAARRYAYRLERLNSTSQELAAATTEDEVFAIVGRSGPDLLTFDRMFLGTIAPDGTTLTSRLITTHGLEDDPVGVFPLAGSGSMEIMEAAEVVHITDLLTCNRPDARALAAHGIRSTLNVPLTLGGAITALLVLGARPFQAFSAEDEQVLGMLARQMGATLDRVRATAELEHRARHDGLTSLANRAEFDRVLAQTVEEITATGEDAVLCYVDLDHFKQVNDTLGHAAGDALLVELAGQLRANTTSGDLVARIGGDEFVIILRNCGMSQGEDVINRLRVWIAAHGFTWDDRHVAVSMSAGLARITPGATPDQVMRSADAACYRAKHAGRNRVARSD